MSNESQYYAPIIQAYLEATKGMQQNQNNQAERQQRQQQLDQQKKQQDELLKQAQQKIENEHDYQQQSLDIQHQARQLATQQAKEATFEHLTNLIKSGTSPEAAASGMGGQFQQGNPIAAQGYQQLGLPGGPPSEDQISVNGQQIPVSGLQTQAQAQQAALADFKNRAGVQAGAAAEAEEPYKIAASQRTEASRKSEMSQQEIFQAQQNKANNDRAEAVAKINGGYHLRGIALMHSLGLEDGSGQASQMAKQLVDSAFNGTSDPTKWTPDQKRIVSAYASANGETLPTNKNYAANLDNIGNLDVLLNQYKDLAQNYSKDSPGGTNTLGTRLAHGQFGGLVNTSDLNAKQDALKAQAGLLAKQFEGQSRTSDANIVRQALGSFDPAATTEENLGKLNTRFQDLQQIVKNTFPGVKPDRVNSVLAARGIQNLSAPTQQKKVATGADLLNYAKTHGVDLPTAQKHATDAGYEIQPVGGLPGGVIPSPSSPTATAPGVQ